MVINDYSSETIEGKVVGPWKCTGNGPWILKGRSGLADFSAEMTLELPDHAMDVAVANGVVMNGAPTPFEGTDEPFSNVSLVFGMPSSGHFGSQAIHGVVRKPKLSDFEDEHR